jgi:hypothetical protein
MKKLIRRWFLKHFPKYEWSDERMTDYERADKMIRDTAHLPEHERWDVSPREDSNRIIGIVWIGKRKRITE